VIRLNPIAKNQNILITDNGCQILFSYETPVAMINKYGSYKTEQFYSTTTSRHINKFLKGLDVTTVKQENINNYLEISK